MKIPLNDTLWHTMTACDIFDVVINLEMSGVRGYLNIFTCADDSSKLDGHVCNLLFQKLNKLVIIFLSLKKTF
jgi:hypothetical protein